MEEKNQRIAYKYNPDSHIINYFCGPAPKSLNW